jgi:hypothetical protein
MHGRGDAPRLVRRVGGGNEQDLVEAELFPPLLGAAQVRDMDGVEGTAEDPDASPLHGWKWSLCVSRSFDGRRPALGRRLSRTSAE